MQIGKRIRLEQHYGLLYIGLQFQQQIYLRLHQAKTINSENNTKRFKNVINLPEALEVYKAAWLILTKTEISVEEIDGREA